jgi:outer membrane protein OmpA-like peptidoglycan-associated protein
MILAAGTEDYNTILSTRRGLKAVTRWLISQSILNQFQVAKEIAEEGKGVDRYPLEALQ